MQQAGATLRCVAQASPCGGFSCCRARALGIRASVVGVRRLSCSAACGIFQDQGSNLGPLHWQVDSCVAVGSMAVVSWVDYPGMYNCKLLRIRLTVLLLEQTPFPLLDAFLNSRSKYSQTGTSLVVQWLRIHLPMQGTRVQFLVREDPTCRGATKPARHNY